MPVHTSTRGSAHAALGAASDGVPAGARLRRVGVAFWAVMAAGFATFAVAVGTDLGGAGVHDLFAGWWINLLHLGATAALVARVVLVPRDRLAWSLMAAAVAAWTLGEIVWWEWQRTDPDPPLPSASDVLWLLFPPLNLLGLALLVRARVPRVPLASWLDGLLGALCVAAVAAAILLPPILDAYDGVAIATSVAYPLGDVLLLAAVVWALGLSGWRPQRDLFLLFGAFTIAATVDSIWVYRSAHGTYENGALMDILWPSASIVIALAAWQGVHVRLPVPSHGLRSLVLPSAFALVAIGVVIAHEHGAESHIALWLAAATLACTIARMAASVAENIKLADARRQALHDGLTGLPNRTLFRDRLGHALAAARRDGTTAAVLVLDVDRFKDVNDTLGHHRGDRLLQVLGERLVHVLREGDTVARLGGDEFAVLLPRIPDAAAAEQVAQAVRMAVSEPVLLDELAVDAEASIGIALYPEHGADVDTLVQHADVAMYVAKREHAGIRLYDPADDEHSPDRLRLVAELRKAATDGQLVLHYQPQVDLATGRVERVEALMRWNHPVHGLLLPGAFIPLAEKTSVIDPLTAFALGTALDDLHEWEQQGLWLGAAVNLSARHLLDLELPGRIGALIERHGVEPARVELEITESMLMVNPARASHVLERLAGLGVRLAVDDFGVGHASLNYLTRLPVDLVKIDRSFVRTMTSDPRHLAVVRSVIELGAELGVDVVAEGVEDAATADALRRLGCRLGQGFHLGRPVPAAAIPELLRDSRPPVANRRRPGPLPAPRPAV